MNYEINNQSCNNNNNHHNQQQPTTTITKNNATIIETAKSSELASIGGRNANDWPYDFQKESRFRG